MSLQGKHFFGAVISVERDHLRQQSADVASLNKGGLSGSVWPRNELEFRRAHSKPLYRLVSQSSLLGRMKMLGECPCERARRIFCNSLCAAGLRILWRLLPAFSRYHKFPAGRCFWLRELASDSRLFVYYRHDSDGRTSHRNSQSGASGSPAFSAR